MINFCTVVSKISLIVLLVGIDLVIVSVVLWIITGYRVTTRDTEGRLLKCSDGAIVVYSSLLFPVVSDTCDEMWEFDLNGLIVYSNVSSGLTLLVVLISVLLYAGPYLSKVSCKLISVWLYYCVKSYVCV